jgi:hypothetical protein
MSKSRVIVLSIFFSLVGFAVGWLVCNRIQQPAITKVIEEPPNTDLPDPRITLPLVRNMALAVKSGTDGRALLAVANEAADYFDSVTLYDKDGPVFYSKHYESGRIEEVAILVNKRRVHQWGFFESGKLMFTSTFEASSPEFPAHKNKEIRQYYDESGKPERIETRMLHGS